MAYTYAQFEHEARKTGLLDQFDKQDLVIAQANPEYGISMLQLMKNRSGAKTSEQKVLADEAVRQLRQNYSGYTSGGRLPEYADEVIQQTDNYYAGRSAYRRQLAEAGGYDSSSYDEDMGAVYSRQSDLERARARENALVSASAATGGVPSSYALMLAQQAGNEVDAQLDETILELRKSAYQQALNAAAKQSTTQPTTSRNPPKDEPKEDDVQEDSVEPKFHEAYIDDSKPLAYVPQGGTFTIIKPDAPHPKQSKRTDAITQSIDGNLNIWKMQGLSKSQLREKLLGYLNNDGFVGNLTDAEFAWLVEYYKDYELI